jgi:hypothetical protein
MNDVRSSSFPWIARIAVLALVALIAIVRLRSHRDESGREGVGTASRVRCTALSPDTFNVAPGTGQEITAHFSGGSGRLDLTWSASGGVFMTTTGRGEQSVLSAQLYVDDFEDGNLDRKLWRSEVTSDTALTEKQGVLRAVVGNGDRDRVARLETSEVIEGDFGAQVTIRDVNANGSRGAVALSFVMLYGHEAHIQAIGAPGLAALEANARDADGTWRTSTSAVYGGGLVNLRLVRVGSTVSCSFDRGSGPVPLGTFTDLSVGPGHLRLETWSLDGHPAVETELDNFGAGQNTIVSWQAPSDAVPGSSYAIKLAEGCEARAVIAKPSAGD